MLIFMFINLQRLELLGIYAVIDLDIFRFINKLSILI